MERLSDEQRRRVEVTTPLVKWMAAQYPQMGEWDDRVQDGHLGLVRAALAYDPDSGRWSGYAAAWVRGSILDGYRSRRHSRARRRHDEVPLGDTDRTASDPDPTPEAVVVARETTREVLDGLSDKERRLVLARTNREQRRLAEADGVTESMVSLRWRLSKERIRRKARRAL